VCLTPKGVLFILVENQIIKLRVNATSLQHYLDLDYSVKVNEIIEVKAEDLNSGCKKDVNIICDYCNKKFTKKYYKYLKQRKIIKKDACFDCFPIKQKEVVQAKYNVDSTMQIKEIKNKSLNTIREKYGVDNVMQYKNIHNKFVNSMIEKHGVEYAQQSYKIREKTKNNNIVKFGVSCPMYNSDLKNKIKSGFLFVNGIRVSKNQFKIAEFLNGALNTNIGGKYADMVLLDNNIIVEYDGSGHDLSVKLGKVSKEIFEEKDKNRIHLFNQLGYKCLIVQNTKEKIIDDNILQNISQYINELKCKNNELLYYKIS